MAPVTLIGVPYHLGNQGVAVGAGPLELLAPEHLPAALGADGDVRVEWLEDPTEGHEIGRVFELDRALAGAVQAAIADGRLPVIVSGNCIACLGAIGGIQAQRPGIVWLDAHPDLQTPDTTGSGFLDGMGLAAATGLCWSAMAGAIPGFEPVRAEDTVLVGIRDIDPPERKRLTEGGFAAIEGGEGPGSLPLAELERALEPIAQRVGGVYLHLDLDAIDASLGHANEHASEGGLGVDDIRAIADAVSSRTPILALSLTAYDPDFDPDHRFRATAVDAAKAAIAER